MTSEQLGSLLGPKMLRALAISLTSAGRARLDKEARYEQEILKVMCVLPGKYRYAQVEAAINASGTWPEDIYECLAANNQTFALVRFYEALNGPQ